MYEYMSYVFMLSFSGLRWCGLGVGDCSLFGFL